MPHNFDTTDSTFTQNSTVNSTTFGQVNNAFLNDEITNEVVVLKKVRRRTDSGDSFFIDNNQNIDLEKLEGKVLNFDSETVDHDGVQIDYDEEPEDGKNLSMSSSSSKAVDEKADKSVYKGIILSVLSSIFFTITATIVKYLKDVHPGQMAVFRFTGIFLFAFPMVMAAKESPFGPKNKRHFLVLRGLAGATSLYLRYSALQFLPLANATVIVLSMPVFVCIFARVFLKEPCGIFHVVAIGVTLVGIAVTSKIDVLVGLNHQEGVDKKSEFIGLGLSMAATLVGSLTYIFVRKVKEIHYSVILMNFSIVAILETSIITAALDGFKLPDCGIAPWLLVMLAILSFYAQLALTKALQVEDASIVSMVRSSSEVVCAFILQIVIFRQIPEWTAWVGAALVSSSVLLSSARKWVNGLDEAHWGRRYLGFTLR